MYTHRALIGFAAVVLAACGSSTDSEDSTESAVAGAAANAASDSAPLVVYSSRAEQLIQPIFEAFTAETGIAVQYVTDDAQPLIQRLKAEGDTTPASVLLTVDAGNLWFAAEEGVLQSLDSPVLQEVVPSPYRDGDNRWFGLSLRARTIIYDNRIVDPADLTGYAGLADPEWAGKLCLRTSKKVYNQSLVAMMIAALGEERTEEVVTGWVANLALDPFSNDTRLIEAIVDGRCAVGVVNTYYLGRLLRDGELPVGVFWQPESLGGVHVNVSGAGVTRHAPNADAARTLLEWLAGPEGQALFGSRNLEFPVRGDVANDPIVAAWGEFDAAQAPLTDAGRLQADAVRLMDRAGYR